jgi:predicted transposase/invertase (TIGR01784 family)
LKRLKENSFESDGLPKILPPKTDIVFKAIFGDERNIGVLREFLEAVISKRIRSLRLLDPINKQRSEDDKLSILDVKAELANGELVNVEMQARNTPGLRSRISYYSGRALVDQMGVGDDYSKLKPVISINVLEKTLFKKSKKCHNVFSMLEEDERFRFNDLQVIHVLDLSRINLEKNETLSDWLSFINSEEEEDFIMVAQKNKAINTAFDYLKIMSADKEQRMLYEARLKMQRDAQSFENAARQEGERKGERKSMIFLYSCQQ